MVSIHLFQNFYNMFAPLFYMYVSPILYFFLYKSQFKFWCYMIPLGLTLYNLSIINTCYFSLCTAKYKLKFTRGTLV